MNILVRSTNQIEYIFEADRFEIANSIVFFYDEDGEPIWIIKDWISFRCVKDKNQKITNPDQYYEKLEETDRE